MVCAMREAVPRSLEINMVCKKNKQIDRDKFDILVFEKIDQSS